MKDGLKTAGAVALALVAMLGLGACGRHNAATAVPWTIALSTDPAPPVIPGNTSFKVLVTDSAGNPVTGATVTVDLVMTEMDMGANQVTLQPQAGGIYTGKAGFTMPGGWNCTVTASAGGHTQTRAFPFKVNAVN